MAKNNLCEDNELVAGCEDEEMVAYRKKALNVITFRIVLDNNDLETANKKTNSFKPEMAHQIFGDSWGIDFWLPATKHRSVLSSQLR
jgi:hypothetical protein